MWYDIFIKGEKMKKLSKIFIAFAFMFMFLLPVALVGCNSKNDNLDFKLQTIYAGKEAYSTVEDTHFMYFCSESVVAFGCVIEEIQAYGPFIITVPEYCYDLTKIITPELTYYHGVNRADNNRIIDIVFENKNKAILKFFIIGDDPTIDRYSFTINKSYSF